MELKFGMQTQYRTEIAARFNRTFMELKCVFHGLGRQSRTVLIVPLWN